MDKAGKWLVIAVLLSGVGYGGYFIAQREVFPSDVQHGACSKRFSKDALDTSLTLGTKFLVANQRPLGNFNYEYDWKTKKLNPDDSQVRQAGALWGLSLLYHNSRDPAFVTPILKGMEFFAKNSLTSPAGGKYIVYPGDRQGSLGTVALVALAHVDFLRSAPPIPPEVRARLMGDAAGYLKQILAARRPDGLFSQSYTHEDGRPKGGPSSYYDGESLLALIKTAKYLPKVSPLGDDLKAEVVRLGTAGHEANVVKALEKARDSDVTKGYYQWSSMSFYELATSGWPDTERFGGYLLDLADWMIDVHKTLYRTRNTGYAYEGIVSAFAWAQQRGDRRAGKYLCTIERGLEKLTGWQVGHPFAEALKDGAADPLALGGVQNEAGAAPLRIDVAQHQMHAVILARRHVFGVQPAAAPTVIDGPLVPVGDAGE